MGTVPIFIARTYYLCYHNIMKKELRTNIIITLISTLLVLTTAEIVMRYAWKMKGWVERPIYQRSFNPYIRYELVPKIKFGNININSDGFRGPEYSLKKPANTFRIVMLGDSETFSIMLPYQDTVSAQLEDILNKNSRSLHYEVLNFGLEGYNTFQELEQLKAKGLKYGPDLIILNYVLNDPEPGEYYFDKSFLTRHSALWRYFNVRIKKILIKRERKKLGIKTEVDHYFYYHQPKYFTRLEKTILEMADISKQNCNKKLVLVIFPTSSTIVKDFREDYPYWPLHKLIQSIPSQNILSINLIDEFNRLNMTPETVSVNYALGESHKNTAAHIVYADYLYRLLKANNLIP